MKALNDIALFIEVARYQSYTQASITLDIPTSTISRRITMLEKDIGIKLLNRNSRRVTLTESGERYFEYCHLLVTNLNIAHEMINSEKDTPKGTLKITAPDIAVKYLAPVIADFSKKYPEISFEIDINAKMVDLISDNFDIALRIGELDDSNLIAHKLFDQTIRLYAGPDYIRCSTQIITPENIHKHQFINIWKKNKINRINLFNNLNEMINLDINSLVLVNNMELIANMTSLNMGIGLIIDAFAEPLVQSGQLVHICPEWFSQKVPFNAVVTSRQLPAKTRLFIEHLKASKKI